jgi:hypothetical protein
VRARARCYIGSWLWQRLKRRSTNTADDMRGELQSRQLADERETSQATSAWWRSRDDEGTQPARTVNQHFNFNHRPSLHQANTYNPRPAKLYIVLQAQHTLPWIQPNHLSSTTTTIPPCQTTTQTPAAPSPPPTTTHGQTQPATTSARQASTSTSNNSTINKTSTLPTATTPSTNPQIPPTHGN